MKLTPKGTPSLGLCVTSQDVFLFRFTLVVRRLGASLGDPVKALKLESIVFTGALSCGRCAPHIGSKVNPSCTTFVVVLVKMNTGFHSTYLKRQAWFH